MTADQTTIYVCTVCRQGDDAEARPGQALFDALRDRLASEPSLKAEPVECLAVCKRAATVALAGAGKWTYVVGDLDAKAHIEEIVAAAKGFAAAENGIVPWKDRPACFKKGVVSRTPPLRFAGREG